MDAVILVHGHGVNRFFMLPMQRYLEREGYRVHNRTYPSHRESIANHAANLREAIRPLVEDCAVERIHFVGHSMGAIIVRQLVTAFPPPKLGRIVLLAPPNKGAMLADFALKLLKGMAPVAASELSTKTDSFVNRLAGRNSEHEIGVLAAAYDHVVARGSTHLEGQRDHLVLKSLHTLPLHRSAPKQVLHFLKNGKFHRTA